MKPGPLPYRKELSAAGSYVHFILTKFNVPRDDAPAGLGLDEAWLEQRFALFEEFCFPSLFGQWNQYFLWLVAFDERTPQRFRDRIRLYQGYGCFHPVFVRPGETEWWRPVIDGYLRENPQVEHVLTSRIDNDDAYGIQYVDAVQNAFRSLKPQNLPTPYSINCLKGIYYDKPNEKFFLLNYPSNPFVTLVEAVRDGGVKSVFQIGHHLIHTIGRQIQIDSPNLSWVQIIHGDNIDNVPRGAPLNIPAAAILAQFSFGFPPLLRSG